MNIHEAMSMWVEGSEGRDLAEQIGVEAAPADSAAVALVLEVLGDGEAHTLQTLDNYLQFDGQDLSGCQIAGCLVRLSMEGHQVNGLPPYDSFGCPQRFKLERSA